MSLQVTRQAKAKALRFGVPLSELMEMVASAAVVTHPKGNRRYHDWVFKIEDETVTDISPFEKRTVITWKPARISSSAH